MRRTVIEPEPSLRERGEVRKTLSLWDATSIIVGIIIGVGLFKTPHDVAASVSSSLEMYGVWVLGGVFTLIGALCYAELATAYPSEGGDFVYLTRAFGRFVGFVFTWTQFWIVRPGSIGAVAFTFAEYARAAGLIRVDAAWTAIATIVVLTAINIAGVKPGKWTQNILTVAKIIGVVAFIVLGLFVSSPTAAEPVAPIAEPSYTFAIIMVLFTYSGWNEMAYVAAEVREPRKNIVRALLYGTLAITALYLLANASLLHALGLGGMRTSNVPPADVARLGLGQIGAMALSVLVCISAIGSVNGMIFTGARIFYATGERHRTFAWLAHWNTARGVPVWSLLAQGAITVAIIGIAAVLNGNAQKDTFERLVLLTTPVFWLFLLMTALSLFVLRGREADVPVPFRVPLYPVTPALLALGSAFMTYSSIKFAWEHRATEALWTVGLIAAGVVVGLIEIALPARATKPKA